MLNDLEVDQYFKFKNMNHGLKSDEKTTKKKINDLQKRIHNCNKVIEYILNTKEWLLFDKIDSKEYINQKVDI